MAESLLDLDGRAMSSTYNGPAAEHLKQEADRQRRFYQATNGGQFKLNPDLIEIAIGEERFLRYPGDDKWLDAQLNEIDPAKLFEKLIVPPALDPNDIGASRDTVVWQGRAYVREVDETWRDEYGRTLRRASHTVWRNADHDLPVTPIGEPEPGPDGRMYQKVRYRDESPSYVPADELQTIDSDWQVVEPPRPWKTQRMNKWFNKTIPDREWFIEDWVPRRQCTGLYGIPGVRKSLWILQAMLAGALGHPFCGLPVEAGPVLGLFCEDDDAEIARRAAQILKHWKRSFGELGHCHYETLVGARLTEFVRFTRSGRMDPTPAFTTFREQLLDIKPRFAALDVGPDFFGGNENDRSQVHAYIRLLDSCAQEANCALMFSAHPSRRGVAERALDSGSTGWEGKVRARLVLHDPAGDEQDGEDERSRAIRMVNTIRNPSNERILTRAKCNYAKPGEQIPLLLKDGVFVPKNIDPGAAPQRGPMRDAACETKFLELMAKVKAAGDYVNKAVSSKGHYAPKVFARHPDRGDFTQSEFENALNRMFGTRIRLDEAGPTGRRHKELVMM